MDARPISSVAAMLCVSAVLTGCAALDQGASKPSAIDAIAKLTDASGADRGHVEVVRRGDDLQLEIIARGFTPGTYGMHVHMVGKCDAPGFMSAGPHWNPTGAQHGRDNPLGQHRGDLPNLVIEPGMIGEVAVVIEGGALSGDGGLLDADGASFIIHAQADDMKTDPTGNSGGRVVCGVFAPG
jgi:superoxide dismutase, Cu-Zn family